MCRCLFILDEVTRFPLKLVLKIFIYCIVILPDRNCIAFCLQQRANGSYRELGYTHLGQWGIHSVCKSAIEFLKYIMGHEAVEEMDELYFKTNCILPLLDRVEKKPVRVRLNILEATFDLKLAQAELKKRRLNDYVDLNHQHVCNLDVSIVSSWIQATVASIVAGVRELLARPDMIGTQVLVFTGLFLQYDFLRKAIVDQFQDKSVYIPQDPHYAVMNGANTYRHEFAGRPKVSDVTLGL